MIFWIIWFVVGLLTALAIAFEAWYDGEDIQLRDIWLLITIIIYGIGSVVISLIVLSTTYNDKVIIKGRKR